MKTTKLILLFIVFILLFNGCTYVIADPVAPTVEKKPPVVPTQTAEPTPTFTQLPTLTPTNTPEPTDTPTPTLVPTPTEIPTPVFASVENDLNPAYIQTISTDYMGVKFNLELITDSSLGPEITKIRLEGGFEHVLAAVIAKDIFEIWWAKGPVPHSFDPHNFNLSEVRADFESFMSLWSRAQETNDPEDWEKVQINKIFANDLNDDRGYQMNPYNFWVMFDGETPDGITSVKTFSVAFVDTLEVKNIQISWVSSFPGEFTAGYGMNIDKDRLIVYLGDTDFRYAEISGGCGVSCVPASYVLRFVPMTITSSVSVGYQKFVSSDDAVLIYDLRDYLIVSPKSYP